MIDPVGAALAGAPVVVGVDDSPGALAAVRVAAREAALRRRALRVVHAVDWPPAAWATTPGWTSPPVEAYRKRAGGMNGAVDAARAVAADLEISTDVTVGDPVPVLLAESRGAALIVVGHRGGGGFPGLLIGSVAEQLASRSAAPVLIVRGREHPDGPVVAGVDGSRTSAAALDFAADESVRRGAELVTVHAWNGDDGTDLNADLPMSYEFWSGEQEESRVLAEAVAGLAERFPDLPVRRVVRRGPARRLLRDWSLAAQLVVVGDRGHGGFAGLLLGSVSQHLLLRAGCPTAVVRPALVAAHGPAIRRGDGCPPATATI
jgi:nucleotide-binding universal stress UspA family protein